MMLYGAIKSGFVAFQPIIIKILPYFTFYKKLGLFVGQKMAINCQGKDMESFSSSQKSTMVVIRLVTFLCLKIPCTNVVQPW